MAQGLASSQSQAAEEVRPCYSAFSNSLLASCSYLLLARCGLLVAACSLQLRLAPCPCGLLLAPCCSPRVNLSVAHLQALSVDRRSSD